ncbi:hypothetical protein F5J12DRAFT_853149 [Pisolithus orientalis]|uniref:uncharacterized protein n=1 Tax=Pisolithus orientalis TaxID=936130 RepID=UPI002223FD78|nr:uncharacterized protein F5J12DRAFT_853149 [Pisolithus orientalis]KAI5996579.1 hypothetical protein F5J12DRAFT_853149 [Pisolithus orientalis]
MMDLRWMDLLLVVAVAPGARAAGPISCFLTTHPPGHRRKSRERVETKRNRYLVPKYGYDLPNRRGREDRRICKNS